MSNIKVPEHVAIIMDGNGRWAQKRGLKRTKGHEKGALTLKNISEYIYDKGVRVLSVYAFSTENWKRDKEEVDFLMDLFIKYFKKNFKFIKEKNIKLVFSGVKKNLSDKVLNAIEKMMNDTKNNTNGIFNVCINYGGQDEIVEATKKIVGDVKSNKLDIDNLDKEMFSKYLFNNLQPVDLVIRTSGEYRISNFMLWQIAYSEFYFTNTLWPDFNKEEFDKALEEYQKRDRRFGGVNKK